MTFKPMLKSSTENQTEQIKDSLTYFLVSIIVIAIVVEPITISIVNGLHITGSNALIIRIFLDIVPIIVAALTLIFATTPLGFIQSQE